MTILMALTAGPAMADDARLDDLFETLRGADSTRWEAAENAIWEEWSHSGSETIDLLLERGRTAMANNDWDLAIQHFTALTDHAPGFAEGWNARATAYYQAGLLGPALSDIARTLVLEPRHFGALAGLGLIREESGDLPAALAAYEAALAIHPHRPDLREAVERVEAQVLGKRI